MRKTGLRRQKLPKKRVGYKEEKRVGQKSEMFYGYENTFKSLNQLEQAIVDYIDYYNNKRIKVKLKGLSPVQYRTKSFT